MKQGLHTNAAGDKCWYQNNKLHRLGGPAIEYTNGGTVWFIHGKYHREDGPAIEYANDDKAWMLNDKRYFDNKAFQAASGLGDMEMTEMVLVHGDVR